jgi:hypothetical protein
MIKTILFLFLGITILENAFNKISKSLDFFLGARND